MKEYSFLLEFEAGTLSAQIKNHFSRMRPYSKISPQMFNQIEKRARDNAAHEIKKFRLPHLKQHEHKRQLQKFEQLMKKWSDSHNMGYK